MNVQAELSLYPLRTDHTGPAIEAFVGLLGARGLHVATGPMSTRVTGERAALFAALAEAFGAAASRDEVVLVAKVSNACPLPPGA